MQIYNWITFGRSSQYFEPKYSSVITQMAAPENIPNGWVQVNNTVVPYLRRHLTNGLPVIFAPLPVIQYGAGLLLDEHVSVQLLIASEQECKTLNGMCKNIGLDFTFQDEVTLMALNDVVKRCAKSVKVTFLPDKNPLAAAKLLTGISGNNKNKVATGQITVHRLLPVKYDTDEEYLQSIVDLSIKPDSRPHNQHVPEIKKPADLPVTKVSTASGTVNKKTLEAPAALDLTQQVATDQTEDDVELVSITPGFRPGNGSFSRGSDAIMWSYPSEGIFVKPEKLHGRTVPTIIKSRIQYVLVETVRRAFFPQCSFRAFMFMVHRSVSPFIYDLNEDDIAKIMTFAKNPSCLLTCPKVISFRDTVEMVPMMRKFLTRVQQYRMMSRVRDKTKLEQSTIEDFCNSMTQGRQIPTVPITLTSAGKQHSLISDEVRDGKKSIIALPEQSKSSPEGPFKSVAITAPSNPIIMSKVPPFMNHPFTVTHENAGAPNKPDLVTTRKYLRISPKPIQGEINKGGLILRSQNPVSPLSGMLLGASGSVSPVQTLHLESAIMVPALHGSSLKSTTLIQPAPSSIPSSNRTTHPFQSVQTGLSNAALSFRNLYSKSPDDMNVNTILSVETQHGTSHHSVRHNAEIAQRQPKTTNQTAAHEHCQIEKRSMQSTSSVAVSDHSVDTLIGKNTKKSDTPTTERCRNDTGNDQMRSNQFRTLQDLPMALCDKMVRNTVSPRFQVMSAIDATQSNVMTLDCSQPEVSSASAPPRMPAKVSLKRRYSPDYGMPSADAPRFAPSPAKSSRGMTEDAEQKEKNGSRGMLTSQISSEDTLGGLLLS